MRRKRFGTILVTGGAGFIGSHVVRHLLAETDADVVNVDKLTYAANLAAADEFARHRRYHFAKACITDYETMRGLLARYRPDAIMHLAAETHVDRSIEGPREFVLANVMGTCVLLEAVRDYLVREGNGIAQSFRFHHISTDEVFGTLGAVGKFSESTPYAPRSPYAASKAGSDHLVRAWYETFGVPVVLSNCCNNYGPGQFPEKLIPLMITKALNWQSLPVYGKGDQVRDWLHVEDHARALCLVLSRGRVGESYNVGANCERQNIEIVEMICDLLDEIAPSPHRRRRELITFVGDRPGHDQRYAIDPGKTMSELGWQPLESLESGMAKTVRWYLENAEWWRSIQSYKGERLGFVTTAEAGPG
jgi:dTDP-glucose 4,6-dehydratase